MATTVAGYEPVVLVVVALLFPFAMMAALLLMDWVERPLRVHEVGLELERFFDTARPDEVETFVSQGYAAAVERYWRRMRPA